MSSGQGGVLTVDYAPCYIPSVSLLVHREWCAHYSLNQGEIQIKPIGQARCPLGSSGIGRHDHCFAEFDIVSDPTDVAWLRRLSRSGILCHLHMLERSSPRHTDYRPILDDQCEEACRHNILTYGNIEETCSLQKLALKTGRET